MSESPVLGDPDAPRRVRIGIEGTVQGVGFRPYVFRLATSLGLGGFVRNDAAGVSIELEGARASIDRFLARLVPGAPQHARIGRVVVDDLRAVGAGSPFMVDASRSGAATTVSVPPDLATCGECLRELVDPANRRYRYPFINCTSCGPRFTITYRLPYDRASTTMASFTMCARCEAEYETPGDRRFHAQPNACAACGPRARLVDAHGAPVSADATDAVIAAARAILGGAIVGVKGLGGYHLACRADDPAAVGRLRSRKHRDDKPFAIMVRDMGMARTLAQVRASEARALAGDSRPIVLLRRRDGSRVAPQVAPARAELGILLPYTPIHHLLMRDAGVPMVLTSGNLSDEPIAYRDDDAFERLGTIADLFLTHDRPIAARCEDSVVRVVRVAGTLQPILLRRARGFVPDAISAPVAATPPVLGVGGQLKNTACVLRERAAVVGPYAGDLADATSFAAYADGIRHLAHLAGVEPAIAAHDLHPDYLSTKYAADSDLDVEAVQHHHAHFAACLAEHGELGPAIGLIFDGTGYGTDGTIWGGEILFGDLGDVARMGHLRPVRMPGGDAAIREPWRMACAWLTDAHDGEPPRCAALERLVSASQWRAISRLSRSRTLSPLTTSVGRLLDACAALVGLRARITYEGQAAMELEACVRDLDLGAAYPVAVHAHDDAIVIDPREMVLAVERDANAGRDCAEISNAVHAGLIYAARLGARVAAERTGARTIVLSGGVFQNVLMLEGLAGALAADGMRVLVPHRLPPNDGGLSYGQAVVAAWRRRSDVPGDSWTGD